MQLPEKLKEVLNTEILCLGWWHQGQVTTEVVVFEMRRARRDYCMMGRWFDDWPTGDEGAPSCHRPGASPLHAEQESKAIPRHNLEQPTRAQSSQNGPWSHV
jgi:hypothetical protein